MSVALLGMQECKQTTAGGTSWLQFVLGSALSVQMSWVGYFVVQGRVHFDELFIVYHLTKASEAKAFRISSVQLLRTSPRLRTGARALCLL